jgi:hypothetical protein
LAGSTMNTFAEPLENIFRINKREGHQARHHDFESDQIFDKTTTL